jgi:hypothetical protein
VYLFKGPPDEFYAGDAISTRRLKAVVRESNIIREHIINFDRWWRTAREGRHRQIKYRIPRFTPEPRPSIFDSAPQDAKDRTIATFLERLDATATDRPTGTARIRRDELKVRVRSWVRLGPYLSGHPGDEHSTQMFKLLAGRARDVVAILRQREDRISREALYRIADFSQRTMPSGMGWPYANGIYGWLQVELWGRRNE